MKKVILHAVYSKRDESQHDVQNNLEERYENLDNIFVLTSKEAPQVKTLKVNVAILSLYVAGVTSNVYVQSLLLP